MALGNIEIKKYLSEMMKSQQLLQEEAPPVLLARPSRRSSLVCIMAERDRHEVQRRRDEEQLARPSLHRTTSDRRRASDDSTPAILSQRTADTDELDDDTHQELEQPQQTQPPQQHPQQEQQESSRRRQQFQEEVGRRLRGLMKLSRLNGTAIEEARADLAALDRDASQVLRIEGKRLVHLELESLQQIEMKLGSVVSSCEQYVQQLRPQYTSQHAQMEQKWQRSFLEGLRRQELELQLAQAQVRTARTRRRTAQNSGQQASSSHQSPSRGGGRSAKGRRGKGKGIARAGKRPCSLAGLLREKEKQLRDEGVILRHVPSIGSRSQAQHPLDAFSSIETTAATAVQTNTRSIRMDSNSGSTHKSRRRQSVSPEKFMLGTQLEDESVFSTRVPASSRVAGGESQSLLSLDAAVADALARQQGHKARSSLELSASMSRNKKMKQGQLQRKTQTDLKLDQKSSVLRDLAPVAGGSVLRSSAMSKNRKVKRKLIANDRRHCPEDKFSLPFIQPKGARGRSALKKHQKLLHRPPQPQHSQQQPAPPSNSLDEPLSSWNQFLLGRKGGSNVGGTSDKQRGQATHAQPQTQSDEEGNGYFTQSELEMAFKFVQRAGASEGGEVAEEICVNEFTRACRQVKKARHKQTAAQSVCQLVISLEDVVTRAASTPAQWFGEHSMSDEGEVLTHAEFEYAIRSTCDELGVLAFENEEDIAVLTRYFDPKDSGQLKLDVTQAGFQSAHKPMDVATAISESGPVLLYLVESTLELQKRPQDVYRILSRNLTGIDFAQFCEGVDDLGMLVGPSAALLAEYGSLELRRQADVPADLHTAHNQSGGDGTLKGDVASSQRLVQYHMTHSELRDVNNYRYFLLQKDRDEATLEPAAPTNTLPSPLRQPSYLYMNGAPSPISKRSNGHSDSPSEKDADGKMRLRQLEQQDAELKSSLQQTSNEMHKLTLSLLSAQESRSVVEAVSLALQKEHAEKRQRRVQELQEREELLRKALDDAASDMQRGLHALETASCSSSPAHRRFKKVPHPHAPSPLDDYNVSTSSSRTPMSSQLTPAPPRGRAGGGSLNFRSQRIKEATSRSPSGVQFRKKNARDFSP
mmetsp:Transcript_12110/g.19718  ORF Transcript_12110/g.19718 Transcript_12110/m.19718 type:complete len:1094 (-) Transcript_12110:4384-7665(-)